MMYCTCGAGGYQGVLLSKYGLHRNHVITPSYSHTLTIISGQKLLTMNFIVLYCVLDNVCQNFNVHTRSESANVIFSNFAQLSFPITDF